MDDSDRTGVTNNRAEPRGILSTFFGALARDLFKMVIAFGIGTGAGALVCWYYGLPLAFSILGGILVLAVALALTTDSWLS